MDHIQVGGPVDVELGAEEIEHLDTESLRSGDAPVGGRRTRSVLRGDRHASTEPEQCGATTAGGRYCDVRRAIEEGPDVLRIQEREVGSDHEPLADRPDTSESCVDGAAQPNVERRACAGTVGGRRPGGVGQCSQPACSSSDCGGIVPCEHPDVSEPGGVQRGEHIVEHRQDEVSTAALIERSLEAGLPPGP